MKLCYIIVKKYYGVKGKKYKLVMKHTDNVITYSKDIEDVYVNKWCYKYWNDKKCLALDEQARALIYMCVEILEKREFDSQKYKTQGLYIVLNNSNLGIEECKSISTSEEPLKYKKNRYDIGYKLASVNEVMLIFYATILFHANKENTDFFREQYVVRDYFKTYAYFACICPKIFCTLLFNQIYLLMLRLNEENSIEEIRKYLENTEILWKQYNYIISDEGNIVTSQKIINDFREIMGYNQEVLDVLADLEDLTSYGFLAFDYKEREAVEGGRIRKAAQGCEYFQYYLYLLRTFSLKDVKPENRLWESLKSLESQVEVLKNKLVEILEDLERNFTSIEDDSANIEEFMTNFITYCRNQAIQLIEV